MADELPLSLIVKLASIVVHAQEATSATASHFDLSTISGLASDPEVAAWLDTIDPAFLPEKRG